jgi:aminopeptidase N/puromycin-sensitive aminopeptidase
MVVAGLVLTAAAQRLPHTAAPEHYQLTVKPHFGNDTFSGDETIDIDVLQSGATLTLNAAEIEIQKAEITFGAAAQTAEVSFDKSKEQMALTVARPLPAGPAKVHIVYTGHLNDQMRGLYLSSENGRKYAVSQFEATDARRAYPSFDEPAYKATFAITAIIPKNDIAISNGRVVSDVPGPGQDEHTVKFTTTPKMSSYLVALAIGEFKCLEGSADGIPIRVCGTPEKYQLGKFALEAAQHVMRSYNQYFTTKYPYGKLDFIGVSDFSAGAMENTACIISRDQLLFGDPRHSTPGHLRNIAQEAVAHEMAHQWFGDLVTMKWWNDSWLNEGFATWMSAKPIAQWKPEWNIPQQEVLSTTRAMSQDSLRSVHPIKVQVETPAEITEIFDSIIYSKAAAMLRMVEGYAGPEVFRRGVNAYLEKYKYANASAQDFWNTVAGASKKPIDRILSSFVQQPGVPLVTIRTACEQGSERLALSQQRYSYDRRLLNAGSSESWAIPICAKGTSEQCTLLDKKEAKLAVAGCGSVNGNAGARGYYRTAYGQQDFRELAKGAETALSTPERIMFVSDAWAAVRVDHEDIGNFLAVAEGLRKDRSPSLLQLLDSDLRFIGEYLLTDADQAKYRAWLRGLLDPIMDDIGWAPSPNDTDERRSLRGDIFFTLGITARDPRAIAEARNLAQQDLQGKTIDATLAAPALSIAARNSDASLFEQFVARLKSPKSPEDYLNHLVALTDFSQPALIGRALEYGLTPQVRNQDALYVYAVALQSPVARKQAWDFLRAHWPQIETKLGEALVGFVVGSTGSFCDVSSREQVQTFFSEHKVASAQRAVQEGLERIDYCIDLKTQQQPKLATWLDRKPAPQAGD